MNNNTFGIVFSVPVKDVIKHGVDIKQMIVKDLEEGNIRVGSILQLLQEKYGNEKSYLTHDFAPYIAVDEETIEVDGDECWYLSEGTGILNHIPFFARFEFDFERFAQDYNLEEIEYTEER